MDDNVTMSDGLKRPYMKDIYAALPKDRWFVLTDVLHEMYPDLSKAGFKSLRTCAGGYLSRRIKWGEAKRRKALLPEGWRMEWYLLSENEK